MAVIVWFFLVLNSLVSGVDCHYEIQACKRIRISRKFPCSITECGSNVTFDCSWRHLKEIPDKMIFPNTTELNLTENTISHIPTDALSKLTNLTVLNLNWVNGKKEVTIKEKAFQNLRKLQELRLSGVHLNHIPRHLPGSLKIIELSYNHIIFLDQKELSGMENITKLWLSKNCFDENPCNIFFNITDTAFERMSKLQQLDLSFNNITKVPKKLPKSLLKLNLATNHIECISREDFSGLHNLTHLMIQGNCPRCQNAPYPCVPCKNTSLQIHRQAFRDLTNLHTLNMGGNSIRYLESFWFKSMPKLKFLLLPFNFLLRAISGEAKWLRCLPNLAILDLSFNFNYGARSYPVTLNLSSDFSYLKSLETLHLEGAVFQKICPRTLEPLYQLKHLSALNLGTNFIIHIAPNIFNKLPPLKIILLSENRLYPITMQNLPHPNDLYYQMPETVSVSPLTRTIPDYKVHRHIKQECFNAGNVLILSRNNIFFISEEQFKGYENIACLNLSHNGFSVALNGTEFSSLPNLTYLDLSFNKIDLVYNRAFKDLPKLEVLDLSYNSHYFQAPGITLNLNFTLNLPVLQILNMSFNAISTLTTKEMYSKSLSELQFQHNKLGKLWKDKAYYNIFTHLTNLSILDISHNSITKIPQQVYENLPHNLTQLRINNNLLTIFEWEKLKVFKQLQILDLSNNVFSQLTFKSNDVPSLKVLNMRGNRIVQLDDGIVKGPSSLKTLYLNHNKLTIINQSTFAESEIETLYIHANPFQCTCDSLDFILWMESSNIEIPQLTTDVKCDTPKKLKHSVLINFDIHQCVNDIEAFIFYIITSSFIFAFMFVTTAAHLFYWDAFYILHYLKAKLNGYRSLYSPESVYDVFVTYDTKDPYVSEWVMDKLLVKLEEEGEKHHPLCLEERDWVLGTPLLDNLTHSIRCSRKTLFILTESYVKTGMFKLAMYLAHQRLLDKNEDVILVLLLEPVLQYSHFLRLRRRLCGKSVMEWPKTAAAEPWFWQNLRNIIRVDNEVLYNKTYINYFTSR